MYRADVEDNRKEYETSKPAEGNLIAMPVCLSRFNEPRGCCNDGGVDERKDTSMRWRLNKLMTTVARI